MPDHLMLYCTASPAWSVRMSVPVPGKQSAVDQTRAPAEVYTENTCRPPDRSRVQATEPLLVTETPRMGWVPVAKLGAPVVAVSFNTESEQSSRPCASVVGAVLVALTGTVGVAGVVVALVDFAWVVLGVLAGVVLTVVVPTAVVFAAAVFAAAVFAAVPVVVAAAFAVDAGGPAGLALAVPALAGAVVVGVLNAGVDFAAVDFAGVDFAGVVFTGVVCVVLGAGAVDATGPRAAAPADVEPSEASTPVNVGAADPLTYAASPPAGLLAPFERPATRKITPNRTPTPMTTTIRRRSQ